MMNTRKVYVVGVGMTKFTKPGSGSGTGERDYPDMGKEAVTKALQDADNLPYSAVEQAVAAYVYGDSTCGQRVLYELGMTGIPVVNVNNNCATGSSALYLAAQLVRGGAKCVLALGFEKMEKGSLTNKYNDRTNPLDKHVTKMIDLAGIDSSPVPAQLFGNAGIEHMKKYGTKAEHFAKIAVKNHEHSVNNPYSQFRDRYSLEQIMSSPKIFGPLTKLQCCPTSDGAAAVLLADESFVAERGLRGRAVEIVAMQMATDTPSSLETDSCMRVVGYDMTRLAASRAYREAGVSPEDVQVVELHDCFSANELITYEALGLCPEGGAGAFIDSGDNTYGGKYVVNPSGGLISKGHPLGATGLAQCSELVWQLRGEAGPRQVPNARLALQHNLGLGGAVVVALYRKSRESAGRVGVAASPEGFKAHKYMAVLEQAMREDEENLIERVRGVYGFKVKNGPGGAEGYWVIDCKTGRGKITYNGKDKADTTIIISDDDIVDLLAGDLNPQKAFFQGKIKVQGNMGLAMKLTDLQKSAAHRIEELKAKL